MPSEIQCHLTLLAVIFYIYDFAMCSAIFVLLLAPTQRQPVITVRVVTLIMHYTWLRMRSEYYVSF